MEVLKEYGKDKKYVDYYDHEEYLEALRNEQEENVRAEAKEEGIAIGLRKGIAQKEKESAINLHLNGVSDELIMKSLNITKEKLNDYLKDLNTNEGA